MFACIHTTGDPARLLECARDFSPCLEQTAPGTVVLDIGGLDRLLGPPRKIAEAMAARASQMGLTANVAVAANPDAAVHAARGLPGITVIPPGQEAAGLGGLPVEVLSPLPETLETLAIWGIRTFRDLARLPLSGISERLGGEGIRLQRLARGEGDRPLRPVDEVVSFEEVLELEHPLTLLEPLSFLLARLLDQLCTRLEERALSALELRLTLRLEDSTEHVRRIRLPVPMRTPREFLKLLQLDLSDHPPAAPIMAVSLAAEAAKPRVVQRGLFDSLSPEPEKLEVTLARIAGVVGEGNVGAPELLNTHRPDAFRITRFHTVLPSHDRKGLVRPIRGFLALRRFRPPLPASVRLVFGRLAEVSARGVRAKVLALAGPWRSSGDWWTTHPWARDEWDAALGDGALYRIYCERQQWFLEGRYD